MSSSRSRAWLVALAACGSGGNGTHALIDAPTSNGSGATCAFLTSGLTGFDAGVDGTPDDFPPAPAGLILCGTEIVIGSSPQGWYLAGTVTSDELFAYYEPMLTAMGYSWTPPADEGNGNTKLVVTKGTFTGALVFNSVDLYVLVTFPP